MTVTEAAQQRLDKLLNRAPSSTAGVRIDGYMGNCRGSTPILKPVAEPEITDETVCAGNVILFVPREYREIFQAATLDYDPSFMGRGLTLTWAHSDSCPCHAQT